MHGPSAGTKKVFVRAGSTVSISVPTIRNQVTDQYKRFALPIIVSRRQHDRGTGVGITRHPGAMYRKHHQHHHYAHDNHSLEISSDHSTIFLFFYLLFLLLVILRLRLLLTRLEGKRIFVFFSFFYFFEFLF